jgi:hypothetical protein
MKSQENWATVFASQSATNLVVRYANENVGVDRGNYFHHSFLAFL